MTWLSFVVIVTQACNAYSAEKQDHSWGQTDSSDDSPLWEERVDDPVSERIDGQLRDPLEIFSTAETRRRKTQQKSCAVYLISYTKLPQLSDKFTDNWLSPTIKKKGWCVNAKLTRAWMKTC